MTFDKITALKSCPLFSQLPENTLAKLSTSAHLREFIDGDVLFSQGKKADGFFLVVKGEIEVFCAGENGREQIMHQFAEGELCGEVPLFEGRAYPASARARGDLSAFYIVGEEFLEVAFDEPEILLEMLAVLSKRLRKFVALVENLSLRDVTARICKYLLDLPQENGVVTLDCSKIDLAARIGTIPETISRSLRKLSQQGAIQINKEHITILQPEMLQCS